MADTMADCEQERTKVLDSLFILARTAYGALNAQYQIAAAFALASNANFFALVYCWSVD